MEKQDKYDALFSELKKEFIYNPQQKKETLRYLKTAVHINEEKLKQKKSYTPMFISLTSLVIAACLTVLFLTNQSTAPNIEHPSSEVAPPKMDEHVTFDVENFGQVHSTLTTDISAFLSNFSLGRAGVSISEEFDPVKIDENGVAIINFTESFIHTFTNVLHDPVLQDPNPIELMNKLNRYAFTTTDVQTIYYLIDGSATAWNEWAQIDDAPITRATYEATISHFPSFETIFTIQDETFYVYGITVNQSKQEVIETLGSDYSEEKDIVIAGHGYFDRLVYEHLELTLVFQQDILLYAYVPIRNSQSFDRYFEAYTGDKQAQIIDEKPTSIENLRRIYSEKSLNQLSVSYDIYETLSLTLSAIIEEKISD